MFRSVQKRSLLRIAKLAVLSQVILLCSLSLAESDEFNIVHIFSENAEIEQRIRALYFERFEARSDLLIYYIEYNGYRCRPPEVGPDYDYFCDMMQPVRARSRIMSDDDWGIVWGGVRRSILIKFLEDDIKVTVTTFLMGP